MKKNDNNNNLDLSKINQATYQLPNNIQEQAPKIGDNNCGGLVRSRASKFVYELVQEREQNQDEQKRSKS